MKKTLIFILIVTVLLAADVSAQEEGAFTSFIQQIAPQLRALCEQPPTPSPEPTREPRPGQSHTSVPPCFILLSRDCEGGIDWRSTPEPIPEREQP